MFPKSLSFSKKQTNKQTMYYDQHTARWILLKKKKKNSACVVIYLKLYNFY